MSYDLCIRGGTIIDGLGGEPYVSDVAVRDGIICQVGSVTGTAEREIDATGLLVTPGFVDPAHPLRRTGHLVGPAQPLLGPRGHHGCDGQLRCRVRAVPAGRS